MKNQRVNADFKKNLLKFGAKENWNNCFHCGNCTATCSLTEDGEMFPRKTIRQIQMGLTDSLSSNVDPWLCYYCGDCTENCPRDANPGELMMSLRRWLSSKYDWTGLSGLLYRSLPVSILFFLIAIAGVIGFSYYENYNLETIMYYGHHFEMFSIVGVLIIILLPNIIKMWYLTIIKPKTKVKFGTYFIKFWELIVHMFTQKRTLGCDDNQVRWFEHLILVFGYLSLLFTTVFLDWFGTTNQFIIILGYVESAVIFLVTFIFMFERMKRAKEISKHSHSSDWFFIIWLFLMGLSAFVVRIFINADLITNNLWLYLIHLIVLVQWALIIVPFGKWTHFLYRSFAIYFANLKQVARNKQKTKLIITKS